MRRLRQAVVFAYILVDLVIMAMAFFAPYFYYYHYYKITPPETKLHLLIYAFWMVVTVLLFSGLQLYLTLRELSVWREIRRVTRALVLATLFTTLLLFLLKVHTFPRLVLTTNFSVALVLLIAWRMLKRQIVQHLVSRGFNNFTVLIIGAGRIGKQLADKLHQKPHLGLRIVGFLDDRLPVGESVKQYQVLGSLHDFAAVVRKNFVQQVYVTIPSERKAVSQIVLGSKALGVELQIIPDHFDFELSDIRLHDIDGMPVLEYHSVSPNYQMIVIKRVMDVAVSLAALALLSPIFLIVAAAIKLESSGPVFYASKRWGKRGRIFKCYKFRSMVRNAEELRCELRAANEAEGPVFKIRNDPRITRVGRWLRRYSIDELPQLWNVLRGDMSLVGPRPLPEEEKVGDYKLEYLHRLSIKPGLTCLWQVRGRSDIPFHRWMKLDDYYIRNWSPGMDMEILLRTIPAVFKGRGAY